MLDLDTDLDLRQLRLLDLFCGAGGCTKAYQRFGFYVVGVDNRPQPHYIGDEFYQADALEYCAAHGAEFDAIHASPPCQKYGKLVHLSGDHPMLIPQVRELLVKMGKPYIIENTNRAPLINPIMLTAAMFGMNILRDRLFECNFFVPFELSPVPLPPVKMGRPVATGEVLQPVGHFSNVQYAREQMGIDWMTGRELSQAIPPIYIEYLCPYLLKAIAAHVN